jgi:DnaA family protein
MTQFDTQLALKLSPQEIYQLDNFYFAEAPLKSAIQSFIAGDNGQSLYLHGPNGFGKTHLSIAMAEEWSQRGQHVIYYAMHDLVQSGMPDLLATATDADIVCLDDIDEVAGKPEWEEALFHCFNRVMVNQGRLLLTAQDTPALMPIALPDLRSRLGSTLVLHLSHLDDEAKQQALNLQAEKRGLTLESDVSSFLLRRYGRNMHNLMDVLQRLDSASLQAQRRLTIPFVKQVMEDD